MTPDITRAQALELLDTLRSGYKKASFQRLLHEALRAIEGDDRRRPQVYQEVCSPVRLPVIAKYGFEATQDGWAQCRSALRPFFADPEVEARNKMLMDTLEEAMRRQADADAPAEVSGHDQDPYKGQQWVVIGGGAQGGIIVKRHRSLQSQELEFRLTVRSRVEQLDRVGDRLHYRRLRGDGPDYGWVSIAYKGKPLLIKVASLKLVDDERPLQTDLKEQVWLGLGRSPKKVWELPDDDSLAVMPVMSDADDLVPDAVELSTAAFGMNVFMGLTFGSPVSQVYALTEKGVLVGFVLFGQVNEKPEMTVHYLAVDPSKQRRGHGRHLLEHVRVRCAELGIPRMVAVCRPHNVAYYRNIGFEVLERGKKGKDSEPGPRGNELSSLRFLVERRLRAPGCTNGPSR